MRSIAREVCCDAEPAPVAPRPDVGVAAGARPAVGLRVSESGMDDRDVAEDADAQVQRLEIDARVRPRHPGEELAALADRAVGVAAQEIGSEVLVVPAGVRMLGRAYVAAVE